MLHLRLQQQLEVIIGVLHDVFKCNFILLVLDQLQGRLLLQQVAAHLQLATRRCPMQGRLSALILEQKICLVFRQQLDNLQVAC